MNYEEAWHDLHDRLEKASASLAKLAAAHKDITHDSDLMQQYMDYERLVNKQIGVRLALGYMHDYRNVLDTNDGETEHAQDNSA